MAAPVQETVIHPTAVVLPGAELGAGVEVGPCCVVEPGVEIGDGCRLMAHVHLRGCTLLGAGSVVGTGSVLGGEPQDTKYDGGRGELRIGAGCRFHEHCTVHRPSDEGGATVLGDGVLMMAGSHVAHNAVVGDEAVLVNHAAVAGHVLVGAGAILSFGVGVHQHCRIGRLSLVAANAAVTLDVPPFSIAAGAYPCRWRAPNVVGMRRAGIPAPARDALRKAMHTLLASGGASVAARTLREDPVPEVAELAAFLLESKRGCCTGGPRPADPSTHTTHD